LRVKPVGRGVERRVFYGEQRFQLLRDLRARALEILQALDSLDVAPLLHGSVARGDVTPRSDIDVVLTDVVPSFKVELALEKAGIHRFNRLLLMATPSHSLKGLVDLGPSLSVTFPLVKLRPIERGFYLFGGVCTADEVREGARKFGVDKRLMLITPTEEGHMERSILGSEVEVARILGVDIEVVKERERVLLRRDRVGRTGMYLKERMPPDTSFERAADQFIRSNPPAGMKLRRRMR